MSGSAVAKPYVTYADFILFEEKSTTKHEWLDGVVYDMAGGTIDHARLQARVTILLGLQLDGWRCEAFGSELAIRVRATGLHTYPDASVICGALETDHENKNAVTNPRLLVEVLSDSTEKYDRGEKFAHYQRIPSLVEYVLVSQHEPRIEVFRRGTDGTWGPVETYVTGQTATLKSIECVLAVDRLYANPLAAA